MIVNFLGEVPILLLFVACFIVIDRAMFGNRLWGIIWAGWRRRLGCKAPLPPLKPIDPSLIIKTVQGVAGSVGAVCDKSESQAPASGSFAPADNAVVQPEEYDKVFAEGRLEVVDGDHWESPVAPQELPADGYNYPDDYNEFDAVTDRQTQAKLKAKIRAAVSETFADTQPERPAKGFDVGEYS